jgi:uncharacterized protein (TIRG00374 family)
LANAAEPAAADGSPEERGTGLEKLGRRLLVPLVLGLLVALGLVLTASPRELMASMRRLDAALLFWVLALSLVNYVLRYIRWDLYLSRLGVRLSRLKSLAVFLVGFLLSVTPGKAGELGKAWLVRELGGGPARRVVPAVLAERVTDLLGVLVLISLGVLPFQGGPWIAGLLLLGLVAMVVAFTWRSLAGAVFRLAAKLPVVKTRIAHLTEMYETLRSLLAPGLLLGAVALSVVAWGAEGVGFWLVVRAYAPDASLLAGIFNYTGSNVIGSLSMLPGGLGAAEGSMTALLHAQGLDTADANLITLVVRGATLWFAVVLGLLALPFVVRWLARR